MRESLRREIDAEYEAQRALNRQAEGRRLQEATLLDPQIGILVERRVRLFQDGARKALRTPREARAIAGALSEDIVAIQAEIRMRLKKAGLPEDYLQPVYRCAACRDTGYVGEPMRERCACYRDRLHARAARAVPHGLSREECFEAYDESVYADRPLPSGKGSQRALMARVKAYCEAYADAFPQNDKPNLLLVGTSGLGKTFMLNCIGNRLHQKGFEIIKLTAYQLFERMRAAVFDRDTDGFAPLLTVPLLMLDDLGTEPMYNNITAEQLFTLLNERALSRLHTIISTNLTLGELQTRYTERICSRMFSRQRTAIIEFQGSDVRLGERRHA